VTPKRCAEGIYDHGLKWLGIEPDPQWAVQRINGGTIISPDGTRLTLDETILPEKGYIIERKVFDKYMAMDAARAGAKIMVKTLAKSIMKDEDSEGSFYVIDCEHMGEILEIKARIVIAADGPESRVAKAFGINSTTKAKHMMSGVQYEMAGVNCERMDLIELHLGAFANGGYAWVFPKGDDIANVGIGINDHKGGKAPIEYLNEFIEHSPLLDDAQAVELNVGGDPVGGLIENLYGDNILVCGDAAGQVDQVTGGGIILGMLGGRAAGIAAANAVRDNDCSKERLKEYEALYDEATFKAMPKIAVIKDLIDSFSDDDLNEIIEYFAALDLKGLSRSDAIKLFFKLSPRLTIKFRKLFKLIL
jgi:digeranylgeranylglycerophospholipid reductase